MDNPMQLRELLALFGFCPSKIYAAAFQCKSRLLEFEKVSLKISGTGGIEGLADISRVPGVF